MLEKLPTAAITSFWNPFNFHKSAYKFDPPLENSYPNSMNWAWKEYSGSARIAMYENHPNLELIIRNGNSAIFRVI